MGVKERKEREFQKRESEILSVAYQLLTEMEPSQMTMELVAEKTEIGRGTIYKHFKSKDEIYARLILNRRERFLKSLRTIDEEGVGRIPRLMKCYMEYCLEDKEAYAVHKRCDNHCIRENLSPEIIEELHQQQLKKTELVKNILVKAIGKEITDSDELIHYTCAAWGMQRGAVDAFLENRFEGTELDETRYFKIVEQMFFGGIPLMFQNRSIDESDTQ